MASLPPVSKLRSRNNQRRQLMGLPIPSIVRLQNFQDDRNEWFRFVRVLLLALGIPMGTMLLLCLILCWQTGELLSDPAAAKRQLLNPNLVWFSHHDLDIIRFKLIRVDQARPEILVMGQSRVAQLRGAMFQPYSFYNLSRVSWPLNTLSDIVQHLPANYSPKVIIFGLDFYMFNSRYNPAYADMAPHFSLPRWRVYLTSLRDAYGDLSADPSIIFAGTPFPSLGLQTRLARRGFRLDGSEVWSAQVERTAGRDPDIKKAARWNEEPLYYGNALDPQVLEDLKKFVQLAKARGIALIAIQMPMYGPVVREMEQEQGPHYGILRDFRKHIADGSFDRMGIITFDFLDFPPQSDDYHYFAGPIHPSEALSAMIVRKIAQDPRVRAILPKLDTASLQRALDKDKNAEQHIHLY